MKRRAALAGSLCLTAIVTFVIVAYGRQSGLFGSDAASDEQALAQAAWIEQPTATPEAAQAAQESSEPVVVDQYIYSDEYVADTSGGQPAAQAATTSRSGGGGSSSSPPPAPVSQPAAPVAPPAVEPDDDVVSPPPSSPSPQSVEVVGTVAGMGNSTLDVDTASGRYTFALSAQTAIGGGPLQVGATVHMHARQASDGTLVATEIEVMGGGGEGEHEDDE